MKNKRFIEKTDKVLNVSKKVVKGTEKTEKVFGVMKKYVLPAAVVALGVYVYATYDMDLGKEIKEKSI